MSKKKENNDIKSKQISDLFIEFADLRETQTKLQSQLDESYDEEIDKKLKRQKKRIKLFYNIFYVIYLPNVIQ